MSCGWGRGGGLLLGHWELVTFLPCSVWLLKDSGNDRIVPYMTEPHYIKLWLGFWQRGDKIPHVSTRSSLLVTQLQIPAKHTNLELLWPVLKIHFLSFDKLDHTTELKLKCQRHSNSRLYLVQRRGPSTGSPEMKTFVQHYFIIFNFMSRRWESALLDLAQASHPSWYLLWRHCHTHRWVGLSPWLS